MHMIDGPESHVKEGVNKESSSNEKRVRFSDKNEIKEVEKYIKDINNPIRTAIRNLVDKITTTLKSAFGSPDNGNYNINEGAGNSSQKVSEIEQSASHANSMKLDALELKSSEAKADDVAHGDQFKWRSKISGKNASQDNIKDEVTRL